MSRWEKDENQDQKQMQEPDSCVPIFFFFLTYLIFIVLLYNLKKGGVTLTLRRAITSCLWCNGR